MFGVLRNKGYIIASLEVERKKMVFTNMHLPHGNYNKSKRLKALSCLLSRIQNNQRFKRLDIGFILGDFNFRCHIDKEVLQKILKNATFDFEQLKPFDEYYNLIDKPCKEPDAFVLNNKECLPPIIHKSNDKENIPPIASRRSNKDKLPPIVVKSVAKIKRSSVAPKPMEKPALPPIIYNPPVKENSLLSAPVEIGSVKYKLRKLKEQAITFPPTYKYEMKANVYRISYKHTPSYTDRIFHIKANKNICVEPVSYNSCFELYGSDHKPVYAQYQIRL